MGLRSIAAVVAVLLVAVGCSSDPDGAGSPSPSAPSSALPTLSTDGWAPETYQRLTTLIEANANQNKVITFDWDNTIQARDVSEATLAQSEANGTLTPGDVPKALAPTFVADGKTHSIKNGIVDYYEALTKVTKGDQGAYPSLAWAVQAYAGWTIEQLVDQTANTYARGSGATDLATGKTTLIGKSDQARPFVYPQMADLLGYLESRGYDVWVVSAGSAWAVRWMVINALNPAIREKYGDSAIHDPEKVVGVSDLTQDTRTLEMRSDQSMRLTGNARYFNLDPAITSKLKITQIVDRTVSWSGGKVSAILETIGRNDLFMAAGDSDGDLYMLRFADNQLLIGRLDKPDLEQVLAEGLSGGQDTVMVQPTFSRDHVGFLPNSCEVRNRTQSDPELATKAEASINTLNSKGWLPGFSSC